MDWILSYARQCVSRGFTSWSGGESVTSLIAASTISILLAFGLFTTVQAVKNLWIFPVWLVILFLVFVFGVTPARIWKENTAMIKRLTTKRISTESIAARRDGNASYVELRLRNVSNLPLHSCYAKVIHYKRLDDGLSYVQLPPIGLKLLWGTWDTGQSKEVSDIGSLDFGMVSLAIADLFVGVEGKRFGGVEPVRSWKLNTPILPDGGHQPYNTGFPLPPGEYEVSLQIGSEHDEFPPSFTTVQISIDDEGQPNCRIVEGAP